MRLLHPGMHLSATDGHVPHDVKADLDRTGRFGTSERWPRASEEQPAGANMVRRCHAGHVRPGQAVSVAMSKGVAVKASQCLPAEKVR